MGTCFGIRPDLGHVKTGTYPNIHGSCQWEVRMALVYRASEQACTDLWCMWCCRLDTQMVDLNAPEPAPKDTAADEEQVEYS